MIGVIANPAEHLVIREFFELFKTPWEFYRSNGKYEILLCAADCNFSENEADVILIYGGRKLLFDAEQKIHIAFQESTNCILSYKGAQIPIYEHTAAFHEDSRGFLVDRDSQLPVTCLRKYNGTTFIRVGYDLFREISYLLTVGQPSVNAGIPTLDLHISLLRDLIVNTGVPLAEIPPVPDGYRFIACLTHDVDHPSIRHHLFDHTMFGFLYRAIFGSVQDVLRGKAPVRILLTNWGAALRLPFVYLRFSKDFWYEFDSYTKIEGGLPSSFFVIAFKDYPGKIGQSLAPSRRACRYGAADVEGHIRKLMSEGCEIGLHGIDAWMDSSSGLAELEEVSRISGIQNIGVRMHWLYFDQQSPAILENAGAEYDSTIGYNETIGYRAGTSQVYRPLGATRLLELPLHIMDTALFFPGHLDLVPKEAHKRVGVIIDNAVRLGGSVTINWHDRSIAPERCWRQFYLDLIGELRRKGAWFATANQAVSWFRMRRSATFEHPDGEGDLGRPKINADTGTHLPSLRLQVHKSQEAQTYASSPGSAGESLSRR